MTPSSLSVSTPIFNGENYDYWNIRMKTFFEAHGLWDVVEEGTAVPEGEIHKISTIEVSKALKQQNAKALYLLHQSISDAILSRIIHATTAKEAWNILKEEFQENKEVRTIKLQCLRREFKSLKMKDFEV